MRAEGQQIVVTPARAIGCGWGPSSRYDGLGCASGGAAQCAGIDLGAVMMHRLALLRL